jgi:hypothetical protein
VSDDAERIRCLRDLEELHTLAQVMNRTRRRDIGRFTVREPHAVTVPFTPEGEVFYNALIELRRDILLVDYDPGVVRLISDTLERQAASCLPALVPILDRFLHLGGAALSDLTDDPDAPEERVDVPVPPELVRRAAELKRLAAALPARDPKLEHLMTVVDDALSAAGPGKVLVFSFFLHTLAYLREQLQAAGYRVEMVTGAVPDEEREILRERFRLPREDRDAVDVLLSSEVGCEGLDYEFCDRLVNYDIPWNPMRVEQRIGRIDRFGQPADKVLIYNFITPGTVEERIFFRCFDRLGVFRDTVGDLEEVLGDIVQDLTRAAMDPALTFEQAEAKARQTADNALRLMEERARLERESKGLLGLDEGFMEELEAMERGGKIISPDDLRLMITEYLAQPRLDGRLSADSRVPSLYRLTLRKEPRAELHAGLRAARRSDRQSSEFLRWLAGNDAFLTVTFDQETALEHREVPFITPVHPLAKLAIEYWQGMPAPIVSGLIARDATVPVGKYMFVCDLWRSVGMNDGVRMVCLAYDVERGSVDETASAELLRLLGETDSALEDGGVGDADTGLRVLDEELHRRRLVELEELRERNEMMVTRRLASVDAYYKNRLERVKEEIATVTNERIARMKGAEQQRIASDYLKKRQEIEGRRGADIIADRLAMGVLEVRRAQ